MSNTISVGGRTLPNVNLERFSGFVADGDVWSDEAAAKYGQQGVDNVWLTDGKDVYVVSQAGLAAHFPQVGEGGTPGTIAGKTMRPIMVYDNVDTPEERVVPGLDLFRGAPAQDAGLSGLAGGMFQRVVDGIKALWKAIAG